MQRSSSASSASDESSLLLFSKNHETMEGKAKAGLHRPFDLLPDELVLEIIMRIPASSICCCALVCKRFQSLSQEDSVWRSVILQKLAECDISTLPEGCNGWKDFAKAYMSTEAKPLAHLAKAVYPKGSQCSKEIKVVFLGLGGVGKSTLVVRFVCGMFVEKYDPTIEDSYRKMTEFGARYFILEILDTACLPGFHHPIYSRAADVVVFVYAQNSKPSFEGLPAVMEEEVSAKKDIPVIVVSNKKDLPQEVPAFSGRLLAARYGGLFLETSAKENKNVDKIFELVVARDLLHQARAVFPPEKLKEKKRCRVM